MASSLKSHHFTVDNSGSGAIVMKHNDDGTSDEVDVEEFRRSTGIILGSTGVPCTALASYHRLVAAGMTPCDADLDRLAETKSKFKKSVAPYPKQSPNGNAAKKQAMEAAAFPPPQPTPAKSAYTTVISTQNGYTVRTVGNRSFLVLREITATSFGEGTASLIVTVELDPSTDSLRHNQSEDHPEFHGLVLGCELVSNPKNAKSSFTIRVPIWSMFNLCSDFLSMLTADDAPDAIRATIAAATRA